MKPAPAKAGKGGKTDPAEAIARHAKQLGFCAVGFAPASLPPKSAEYLNDFLAQNYHGTMEWLQARATLRGDPKALWPEVKSVISLGFSYAPEGDALGGLAFKSKGNISVYARNRDYHDIIKGKLKHLGQFIASNFGGTLKVFVDTAPVMEKPLAQQTGIGWQGKHSNLVSREHGSWLFLSEIFTTLELEQSPKLGGQCGTCHACLDICPTNAFPAPYKLDARRCISYLTIEHDGPIDEEFRNAIGNRIYGCDDCLAVCPWNRFAKPAQEMKFFARPDLVAPDLAHLASLTDESFRALFSGSPIKRIGHRRFLRNVLIAIGNSGDCALRGAALFHVSSADPTVADAARWALGKLPC